MMRLSAARCAALAFAVAGAVAPSAGAQEHVHGPDAMLAGTNWLPRSAAMGGRHFAAGDWSLSGHAMATVIGVRERGPRGDDAVFSTNYAMLGGSRALGPGTLSVAVMGSLEPAMGPRGYPLLLQTGESADGTSPLHDRQHPHDLVMELGALYTAPVEAGLDVFVYAAPVGSPAFGPLPFMHRASADGLMRAPISHHTQDAAHITYGVITAGVISEQRLKLEVSAFNGREPDERRWNVEPPRFDSFATRVAIRLGANVALQASVAQASSPERLHPGIDANRLSASLTWNRPLVNGSWQTTAAIGRVKTKRTTIPVPEARRTFPEPVLQHYLALVEETGIPEDSLILFFPERSQVGVLLETSAQVGAWTAAMRAERASKAELFPPADLRHSRIYTVGRLDVAVARQVLRTALGTVDLGLGAGLPFVRGDLEQEYGGQQVSGHAFVRYTVH